jgi:glycosyltransferase involved in cell wall biosynthesis
MILMNRNNAQCFGSLTNIPTPYRIYFYTQLARELQNHGWHLEVLFMAMTEPNRYWSFSPEQWHFSYTVSRDRPFTIGDQPVHFNPDIIAKLLHRPPKLLLVSGAWFHPTNQAVLWFQRLKQTTKIYFWSESNLKWSPYSNGFVGKWRAVTYQAFDGYVIPGQFAREYLFRFCPKARSKPLIYLPNLVDESKYSKQVDQLRQNRTRLRSQTNIPTAQKVLFGAARLAPSKGIVELLRGYAALAEPGRSELSIFIAGEGAQRSEIEGFIQKNNLANIHLLGHLDEEEVIQWYAIADGFVLPSLGDPYPLAVIEAAFAGLPLLLSDNVGCYPEALEPGKNGWLFDPHDINSVKEALTAFASSSPEKLFNIGQQSRHIANTRFRTDKVIPRFVSEILA